MYFAGEFVMVLCIAQLVRIWSTLRYVQGVLGLSMERCWGAGIDTCISHCFFMAWIGQTFGYLVQCAGGVEYRTALTMSDIFGCPLI